MVFSGKSDLSTSDMLDLTKMWSFLRITLRILQRPKVLMFLSVITIFFLLNRSNNPAVLKAHVVFEGIKRSVSFEKGDDALKLRYFIMVAFADVALNKLPPAHVELLKYDEGVQDYVPLPLDTILEEDIKVKVKLTGDKGPILFHRVKNNTPYRLWNSATTSLLQRSNNIISCNGSFKDMDYDTVAKTKGSSITGFAFFFEDTVTSKTYVLNTTSEGKIIVAAEYNANGRTESSMRFWPTYYWSFTVFRNLKYKTYLGCEKDGGSLLVPMNSTKYPDPRALFITNKPQF